jgi:cytochrome c oxidase subunit II
MDRLALVISRLTRGRSRLRPLLAALVLGLTVSGCEGAQSALAPAGRDAAELFQLFLGMLAGAAVIWVLLIGAAVLAVLGRPGRHARRAADVLIIGGGVVFPTLGLAALLVLGLQALPDGTDDGARLRIRVHGEQFWWRVTYERDGERVFSANEIHLPAGEPVDFVLTTADVIHSFWIPSLGGKMDMMPGRTNRLVLTPTTPGVYRGACAELCGTSHALMAFAVEVHEPEAFDAWLASEAASATPTTETDGRRLFLASGCGACHWVRGIVELGTVGPDLTHFGSRRTLGAGMAENTVDAVARWIVDPGAMKPGVGMPAYAMLDQAEIDAIARFLGTLQ